MYTDKENDRAKKLISNHSKLTNIMLYVKPAQEINNRQKDLINLYKSNFVKLVDIHNLLIGGVNILLNITLFVNYKSIILTTLLEYEYNILIFDEYKITLELEKIYTAFYKYIYSF